MINHSAISNFTKAILADTINYAYLKKSAEAFKDFLVEQSTLDIDNQSNREDIQLQNGVALSTSFAAMCITDLIRTRKFVRGIFKAVEDIRLKDSKKPCHILYAGTGPFATLVLPLLTQYSNQEIQLTCLEINEQTIQYLKNLIHKLGIESYINSIQCLDATKYGIKHAHQIDILISETMQHALVREQQVPIMTNLVHQLRKDAIIIPNNIKIDLAWMDTTTVIPPTIRAHDKYQMIRTLWDFDPVFMRAQTQQLPNDWVLPLTEQLPIPLDVDTPYDKLVLLTSIQTYKDEWIAVDESGLTIPKILLDNRDIKGTKKELSLSYHLGDSPAYQYQLE